MTVTYELQCCKTCGLRFLPVDWLAHRVEGYCREKCLPKPETKDEQQENDALEQNDLFA